VNEILTLTILASRSSASVPRMPKNLIHLPHEVAGVFQSFVIGSSYGIFFTCRTSRQGSSRTWCSQRL